MPITNHQIFITKERPKVRHPAFQRQKYLTINTRTLLPIELPRTLKGGFLCQESRKGSLLWVRSHFIVTAFGEPCVDHNVGEVESVWDETDFPCWWGDGVDR